MRDWAPLWKKGELLTIDYGDTMPSLYHRRPAGTIRGYAHHQLLTGPDLYQSPGRCDITADVNFSDLENWGHQLNWQTLANSTLTEFLSARLPNHSLTQQLESAGTAFRTLIQSPVERP
jgi:SAM-dependent MidA family methyltransferase